MLSGAGEISATVPGDLTATLASDGHPLFQDWSTVIVGEDENGKITHHGIMQPQTRYEAQVGSITCAGVAAYPHGYIYTGSKNWGPAGTTVPRPDPVKIVRDLWTWIQNQEDSNLGVILAGAASSTVRIGSNEEPYRLRWYEIPDLGEEIDKLASETPFDFVESAEWKNSKTGVDFKVTLGFPRLGKARPELRFADGENIIGNVEVETLDTFANSVIGIGNGEASTMKTATATKRDGRLRRQKVLTDKTATQTRISARVRTYLEILNLGIDITSVTIRDHPNARITDLNVGDDIRVRTKVETYGLVDIWLRVLSIAETDASEDVVLTTSATAFFNYAPAEELSS